MEQVISARELLTAWKRIEQADNDIRLTYNNLCDQIRRLRQLVEEYEVKRLELFKREFQARGMTWCTNCTTVISESEARLVVVHGTRETYIGSRQECRPTFPSFSTLCRQCSVCYDCTIERHGSKGSYNYEAQNQSSFYVSPVEKRDDGYYVCKADTYWVKLGDSECLIDEPPNKLVDELVEKWGLPPRIEIRSNMFNLQDVLIIGGRSLSR